MKKIKYVYWFDNGNIVLFDDKNQQIPKLHFNILTKIKEMGKELDYEFAEDIKVNEEL